MNLTKITNEELVQELKTRLQENEILQQQVNQLNIGLKSVNQKLAESEALKSHFISNISNELVNPFTSVLAIAENILSVEKENWKKVISMISLIHTEVFNLDFQLKNIFAAAKLEAGENSPEISMINIDLLFESIINSFKYETKRKHLSLDFKSINKSIDNQIYFKSDAQKIHLLISNLLSNAIKFSYDEGLIHITVTKDEKELTIIVQDFGQGISKTNELIIFDRFKRIDSGINSINRGHGLGLSIIKAITEILEGTIEFTSDLGKGTKFTIVLNESMIEASGVSIDADELFFKDEKF
jgi:two-component system, OmpR family, phosphate regulon sensor histidine kinase PhoR